MYSLVLGLFLGILQIGAINWRIQHMLEGNQLPVLTASIAINISYYLSIAFVMKQDIAGYIGFAVGSTLVTMIQTQKNKLTRKHEKI